MYAPPEVFQWPAQGNPSSRGTSDDFTKMFLHSEVSSLLHALGRRGPHEHHNKENVLRSDEIPLMTLLTSFLLCVATCVSLRAILRVLSEGSCDQAQVGFHQNNVPVQIDHNLLMSLAALTSACVPSRGGTPSKEKRLCRNLMADATAAYSSVGV